MPNVTCRLLIFLLPLAVLGCEQPPRASYSHTASSAATEIPVIAPESQSYDVSSPVTVRLTNSTSRQFGYNLCRSSLERLREDDWMPVQPMLAEACTAELRMLRPGQAVTFSFRLNPPAVAGQYRIRTTLEDPQARTRLPVVSGIFVLTRETSD